MNKQEKKQKEARSCDKKSKIQAFDEQLRDSSILDPRSTRATGIGLTSVLFLLRAVNPGILALTRCRTGRASESVFINGPLGSGGCPGPLQRGSNEGLAFCALKYRLIAPGFWPTFLRHRPARPPPSERDRPTEYFRNLEFDGQLGA